jgi:hypothetical protein
LPVLTSRHDKPGNAEIVRFYIAASPAFIAAGLGYQKREQERSDFSALIERLTRDRALVLGGGSVLEESRERS